MIFRNSFVGLLMICMTSNAAAQDAFGFERERQADIRASVGVSVPFGNGNRERADLQPRFNLQVETSETDWQSRARHISDPHIDPRRNLRQAQISLTLENQPRFLVNGVAPLDPPVLQSSQDDGQQDPDDSTNGGDNVQEPDAGDHIARGALAVGGVVATVVAVGIGLILISCQSDEGCGE